MPPRSVLWQRKSPATYQNVPRHGEASTTPDIRDPLPGSDCDQRDRMCQEQKQRTYERLAGPATDQVQAACDGNRHAGEGG